MEINLSDRTLKRIVHNLKTFHLRGMHTIKKAELLQEDIEMFEEMLDSAEPVTRRG